MFTGRTDPEAEAPILWPSHEKSSSLLLTPWGKKNLMSRKCEEEKGMTEDKMVGQHHRNYQHEFDTTLGGCGRQEGLACSGPWGHEESDTT